MGLGDSMVGVLRVIDILLPRVFSCLLLFLLLLGTLPTSAEHTVYEVSLVEEDRSLPPGGSGSPLLFYMDWDGTKMLLRGYGAQDELRVVDMDLETLAILEDPAPGFDLKGCSLTFSGEWAVAWGPVTGEEIDTLVVYNLTSYAIEPDCVPVGIIDIVSIDHANLLGGDMILAVAGRDALGTSRFLMMEMWTGYILTDIEVPGNVSVTEIVNSDNMMVLLLKDGSLLRYSQRSWTLSERLEIFPELFTARSCQNETLFLLGDGDGHISSLSPVGEQKHMNLSAPPAPIQALSFGRHLTNGPCYVSAVPSSGQGSVIRLWNVHKENWTLMNETEMGSTVTGLLSDPNEQAIFAAAFTDGSLQFYRFEVNERIISEPPPPEEPGFNFGDDVLPIVSSIIIVSVIVFVVYRYRKRGSE